MKPISSSGIEGGAVIAPQSAKGSSGFGGVLTEAVAKVDALQNAADVEAQKMAHGEGNLHELSLSLEKADIAMRVAVKVRNKLVDAYNEVMRMSV